MKKFLLSLFALLGVLNAQAAWEKITTLTVGDVVVFAFDNETVAKEMTSIGTVGSGTTPVGLVSDYTGTPEGTYPLTVVAGNTENSFAFQDAEGAYLSWSSGNSLTTSKTLDDASSWTATYNGTTSKWDIYNVGTPARKLQYNTGNPRLACYTSAQKPVDLWKQVAGAVVAKPVITPSGGYFLNTQEVTFSCATEGAAIYYTIDGSDPANGNDPSGSATRYERTLRVTQNTTVRAVAFKDGAKSAEATATFTQIQSYSSFASMSGLESDTPFNYTGSAFILAKPTAKYVYIYDGSNFSLIYDATGEKTAAAEVGKYITPGWMGKVSIFKKLFELVPDEAIVVNSDPVQPVNYPAIALGSAVQNQVFTLKDVTYFSVDGKDISITVNNEDKDISEAQGVYGYNQFEIEIPTFEAGKTYEIVGAIGQYNDKVQFWPITIEEEKEPTPTPEIGFYVTGTMCEWGIVEANKMELNEELVGKGTKEFSLTLPLVANAEVKVVASYDGSTPNGWFPAGEAGSGNKYVVPSDGTYTVYCRPNGDGDETWIDNCLKVVRKAAPVATQNAGFEESEESNAIGIRTYQKDVKGEEVAQMQEVTGWTIVENGDARAAGVFAYGSESFLGGEGYVAPAAQYAFEEGATKALGMVAVWTADLQYTQVVNLAPGNYMLQVPVYNAGGANAVSANKFGADGTFASATQFTVDQWTVLNVEFTVEATKDVTISLGYVAANSGSGAMPHLFIESAKLYSGDENISAAKAEADLRCKTLNAIIALDKAKETKLAALNALVPGEGLFQYDAQAINLAKEAVVLAETVEAVEAVAMPTPTQPDAKKQYTFQLKEGGKYMAVNEGIKLSDTACPFSFVAVEGGWALKNGDAYVANTGNAWTMSMTADPYAWKVSSLGEGYYTLAKASNAAQLIGINVDAEAVAGTPCYADKGEGDKSTWAIAEYVAPTYTVTISDEIQNGTVEATPTVAAASETVSLTAKPAEGYELVSFKVEGVNSDIEVVVGEDHVFIMPDDDVIVSATFVEAAPASGVTLVASEGAYAESANNYVKEWTSNTNPIVTVTTGANNMDKRVTETFQWHSGSAGSSTYTIAVPINYIITSCTITAKGRTAEQTITAGENVKTFGTEDYDELVISNLSNPSTSFTLTGANASGLLIQKIELGIAPNPNFNISNAKAYTLTTPRGSLGVSDGQLVSTAKDFTASNFAIISYNDAYYLWSVEAGRFIQDTGDASNYAPTPISFVALDGGKFQLRYGNNAINISSGYAPGLVINGWTTVDEGNAYTIEAAADFDATEALAILATPITFTNKVTDLANLSNVKAYVITNARGTWNVNNGETAMTTKKFLPDAASEQFALLQMEGKNFIYSVNAKKFLNPDNTFGSPVPVNISATGNEDYPWFFSFDANHNINVSGTKILIDDWSTIDAGNSNAIIEATDFDSKDAMAALYEYFRLFADGKYYINNVGTGKYLAAGSNWGTHAVVNADGLDYDIKMADGKYTLDSQVSNGGNNHYLNGEWNDGAAMGWIFNEVSEGVYTISNGTNFLTAGENGVVTLAADGTVDAAKWTLKTLEDRIAELAAATAEAPVDATFLIQDANFGRNDLRKSAWTMVASNQNLSGGEDNNGSVGNNCAESYHSTFTLSQTLANAPAGKYKMTAQGFYRQDDGATEDLPVFYANDKTANFPAKTGSEGSMTDASKSFSAGQYTIEPIEVTVFENGQLTVGAKGTAVHQWVIFDNFRLSYLGSEIPAEEFAPAYDTALSNAKKALDDETYAAVTGEEKTALAAAIETYSTVDETVDAYKTAISALTAATTTFTGAKADYDALVAAKAANAERSYAYADADKKAAAEATLTVEATSAADAQEKTAAIWTAFRKYADSHALAEGVEGAINMTDYIVNPNAAEAIAEPWTVVKGEGSGGSLNILDGEPLTDGEGNTYKYFDGGDWNANAWDVALKQTINLPAGKYMITASGRASADVQLSLLVGEEKTAIPAIGATGGLFGRGWDDASKEFELDKASDVVIGVQGVTSVVHNWMSFTRFRLVCLEKGVEPTTYAISVTPAENGTVEADKTTAAEGETVNVTVTPAEGYMVDEAYWTFVDGAGTPQKNEFREPEEGNSASFTMPAADVTITITFKEIPAPGKEYQGLIEQTMMSRADYSVAGTSTSDQTVTVAPAGVGKANVTFSGFTMPGAPFTVSEFTIEATATANGDGSVSYAAEGFNVSVQMGMMSVSYAGKLEGIQATADAIPGFRLTLTQASIDEIYFAADAEAIAALKKTFIPVATKVYEGVIEQTMMSRADYSVAGTSTSDQTVTVAPAGVGKANVTFSGFTMPGAPFTVSEFTIEATATANGDGSVSYAAEGFNVSVQMGMMSVSYAGKLEGIQATADAIPGFRLTLTQASIDEIYFAADADAVAALKDTLVPVGIKNVKGAQNVGTIYDLSGRKVEKMVKGGIYIVNGRKVSFK